MPTTLPLAKYILRYKPLLPSFGFAVLLLTFRLSVTGSISFVFLMWNLFLAFLPLLFSHRLRLSRPGLRNLIKLSLCVLFLPNAPYIITDLFHLRHSISNWLWFDTLLIASFAWCGLLCYFYTLKNIEHFLNEIFSRTFVLIALSILHFLCAFGMYIGRYMRFNSWDIVSNPLYLASEISHILFHPMQHQRAWGMTLLYGLFLWVVYKQKKPIRLIDAN